jgi:hypothetical protein
MSVFKSALLTSKRRPHFQAHKWFWNEHKLYHGPRRGLKLRTTVLSRASSNLAGQSGDCNVVSRYYSVDFYQNLYPEQGRRQEKKQSNYLPGFWRKRENS